MPLKTRKKKSDKFRKKIKRKITAKGRASKFNYYISSLPCPICFEKIENKDNRIITPCRHIFHKDCLHQWCEMNKRMNYQSICTCPICRKELSNFNDEINNIIPQTQNSLVNDITTPISPPNLRILREQNRMNMREEIDQLQQRLRRANINPSFVRIPGVRFQREPGQARPSPMRRNSNNGDPGSDGEGKKTRRRKRKNKKN